MSLPKTCFVIIGYGKKPSYANGKHRILDLEETYSLLIKPVFDALNISCYRAIDKNLTGSIDKLMLREIREADIAVVDISTLNANVMWELGVRHALKSKHTIVICEKEQMGSIPFDINSFVVHQYVHSEAGIPYNEVERFRAQLTKVVNGILQLDENFTDSPVFTFLGDDFKMKAAESPDLILNEGDSFAGILDKAESAKKKKNFDEAIILFSKAKTFAENQIVFRENLSFIISRIALCTYKSEKPNLLESLISARQILNVLEPERTTDTEVLGISGAINKRLFELSNNDMYLDAAIQSYERGFTLKNDHYNGINAAFMYYLKASLLKSEGKEWEDTKLKADYLRNTTLQIALDLEKAQGFKDSGDDVWVLFTIAEAYNMKGQNENALNYENKATAFASEQGDTFSPGSYADQKLKLMPILSKFN